MAFPRGAGLHLLLKETRQDFRVKYSNATYFRAVAAPAAVRVLP